MTDLTDAYQEVSAQENKLLRQQIFLMHEMISGGIRLQVELETALKALPKRYQYRAQVMDSLAVYDHLYERLTKWLHDNEGTVFYEKHES